MDLNNKIHSFKNDDEFIIFAIKQEPVFYTSNGITYFDFDFSDNYNDCINNNEFFKIEDEMSNIKKRKELNYRLIVKKINNIV